MLTLVYCRALLKPGVHWTKSITSSLVDALLCASPTGLLIVPWIDPTHPASLLAVLSIWEAHTSESPPNCEILPQHHLPAEASPNFLQHVYK